MQSDSIVVPWEYGEFTVLKQGAMCAPATFNLRDGRRIQPFAIAPWEDDDDEAFRQLPPLLKRLRGEWPCVPFGMPDAREDLSANWKPDQAPDLNLGAWFHGPGSNIVWNVIDRSEASVTLEAIYPDAHPIARLVRRITGSSSEARLDFDLDVYPRRDCKLPVGVHPTFRLPEQTQSARLSIDGDLTVHTYPVELEPGVSGLPVGSTFRSLESAHWADGSAVDLSRHPLAVETEELVLVSGVAGRATLDNRHENYRVSLDWNPHDFASCALWVSNHGRGYFPWNDRFRGLGIEMVTAPFDLGAAVASNGSTPLHVAGVPCFVEFTAGDIWSTSYSIGVTPL